MDKSSKLQRYSRKDYSQQVVFPVEIVGRDGVVRRYSFQSSVRLYQRRIASAPGRYSDPELVRAEVTHCRQRIRQLRQSYYRRYGHSDLAVTAQDTGEFAGEVAAFLRRCFGELRLELVALDAMGEQRAWYFAHPESGVPYLLTLYRFEHYGPCPAREAFFRDLRVLRANQGVEVEALVAFHHSGDCGLVLSCTGEHVDAPLIGEEDTAPELPINEPWTEGLRAIAQSDLEQALAHLEQAQLESPYSRKIAVACASVAGMLKHHPQTETAARIGLGALPDDQALRTLLALSLLKQGRVQAAEAEIQRLEGSPRLPHPWLLQGLIALRGARLRQASRLLSRALGAPRLSGQAPLIRSLRLRVGLLLGFGLLGWVGVLVAAACLLVSAPALHLISLALAVFGLSASAVSLLGLSRRLSNQSLIALNLPPVEAIGSRGPQLDDLTDA